MNDVTQILFAIEQGSPRAAADLLPLVYAELRKLAAMKLAREKPGLTLEPTALVHEAFLRLVGGGPGKDWDSRGHFFAAAAEAMRRILVENARRKRREKHGGGRLRVELGDATAVGRMSSEDLLALDEAMTKLAADEPIKARLVQLRFFSGLSLEEASEILGVSAVTAKRYWRYAKAWLHREMAGEGDTGDACAPASGITRTD